MCVRANEKRTLYSTERKITIGIHKTKGFFALYSCHRICWIIFYRSHQTWLYLSFRIIYFLYLISSLSSGLPFFFRLCCGYRRENGGWGQSGHKYWYSQQFLEGFSMLQRVTEKREASATAQRMMIHKVWTVLSAFCSAPSIAFFKLFCSLSLFAGLLLFDTYNRQQQQQKRAIQRCQTKLNWSLVFLFYEKTMNKWTFFASLHKLGSIVNSMRFYYTPINPILYSIYT